MKEIKVIKHRELPNLSHVTKTTVEPLHRQLPTDAELRASWMKAVEDEKSRQSLNDKPMQNYLFGGI